MRRTGQARRSRRARLAGLAAGGLVLAAGFTGCGNAGGGGSSTVTAEMGASAASTAGGSAARDAASCIAALSPWTQYIADTEDFSGWVSTVGQNSPVVQLPQNAAKVFLGEVGKSGDTKASNDGFNQLDQACSTFATTHPAFNFRGLPPAPTLPT